MVKCGGWGRVVVRWGGGEVRWVARYLRLFYYGFNIEINYAIINHPNSAK